MDPEEITRAHSAIARGADPQAVAARFRERTGQDLPSPASMQDAAKQTPEAALARTNARSGSGVTDFLAMLRHGATLGFDDDVADFIKPGAGAEIRQRVADRRLLNPGASALSEIAGGVAIPVGAGGSAVRAGKGLLSGVARGAAAGGAVSGVAGFGEATGTVGERAKAAIPTTLIGTVAGGAAGSLPGLLNAAMRRAPGRGERVAKELVETTGLSGDINAVRDASVARVRAARAQHYGPLDALGKVQVDGVPNPVTLKEAQKLLKKLEMADPIAAQKVSAGMETAFPGIREADAAYAAAIGPDTALREGAKMVTKPAADIRRAQRGLLGDAATNFRQGELYRVLSKLQQRDEDAVGLLRQYMDAGPETRAQLRTMFDNDESFERFLGVLRREEGAEKVIGQLPRAAMLAALGGGGYVGARWSSP